MRHLILSLLVLGFSQNLQAKLDVSKPSSENNASNKEHFECANRIEASGKVYLECVRSVKEEPVKSLSAGVTFKEPRSTASANNQQKKDKRTPAQEQVQVPSDALFCFTYYTSSRYQITVRCNGSVVRGFNASTSSRDRMHFLNVLLRAGSEAGQFLVEAGFIPAGCLYNYDNREFICAYYRVPQN